MDFTTRTQRVDALLTAIASLKEATKKEDTTKWVLSDVATATRAVVYSAKSSELPRASELAAWTRDTQARFETAEQLLQTAKDAFPEKATDQRVVVLADLLDLILSWVGVLIVWGSLLSASSTVPVRIAFWYMVTILVIIAFHSDGSYRANEGRLSEQWWVRGPYTWLVPTKLFAPVIVAGLFTSMWLGFAHLYLEHQNPEGQECVVVVNNQEKRYSPPCRDGETLAPQDKFTWEQAKERSLMTLAAFNGPHEKDPPQLRALVVWELRCAIVLVLGIFAILINRLSDF